MSLYIKSFLTLDETSKDRSNPNSLRSGKAGSRRQDIRRICNALLEHLFSQCTCTNQDRAVCWFVLGDSCNCGENSGGGKRYKQAVKSHLRSLLSFKYSRLPEPLARMIRGAPIYQSIPRRGGNDDTIRTRRWLPNSGEGYANSTCIYMTLRLTPSCRRYDICMRTENKLPDAHDAPTQEYSMRQS